MNAKTKPLLSVRSPALGLLPRRTGFAQTRTLRAPLVPRQSTSRIVEPSTLQQHDSVAAQLKRIPHRDAEVWVILGLLLLVTLIAVYLFWAKMATTWPLY